MGGLRNFLPLCIIIVLSLYLSCITEARYHPHKPSAIVVGSVFCDTCFQNDVSKGSHYISGATVAVECAKGTSTPSFYQETKTNKQGKFKVQLPFSINKHVTKIQGCIVKLVKSSQPFCSIPSTSTSSFIHLKHKNQKNHIFSAGFFTFRPLKQSNLCNQKQFIPPIPTLPTPIIPTPLPGPVIPSPLIPSPLPGPVIPTPIIPGPLPGPVIPSPIIPGPLPGPVIPTPVIPSPLEPPSTPVIVLPPMPPLPTLPPVPGLVPPTLPIPLPPTPLVPGIPPRKTKKMNP